MGVYVGFDGFGACGFGVYVGFKGLEDACSGVLETALFRFGVCTDLLARRAVQSVRV